LRRQRQGGSVSAKNTVQWWVAVATVEIAGTRQLRSVSAAQPGPRRPPAQAPRSSEFNRLISSLPVNPADYLTRSRA
jgi:hypothetical protein